MAAVLHTHARYSRCCLHAHADPCWSILALCSYYRAYADTEDSNGHGTHVSGTLVGMPYGTSLDSKPSGGYVGMAPDAKIAFIGGCWGLGQGLWYRDCR